MLPTYGCGNGQGAVPKQVIKFLNDERNRSLIPRCDRRRQHELRRGLRLAGDVIAQKCGVPVLYRFELFGTPDDVHAVTTGLEAFWTQQLQTSI